MKAAAIQQFGGPEVIEIIEREKPKPNDDEVLIEVKACGVNPIDMKIRDGSSFAAQQLNFPITLGYDVSGVIKACGENVTGFNIGDSVVGLIGFPKSPGSYAEYVCAHHQHIVKNEFNIAHDITGGLSLVALTAWKAVISEGRLQKGEKVFIHAGAGGVGHLATQYALSLSADVACSASGEDIAYLQSLGVKTVIDFRTQNFIEEINNMDLVIDLVGGETGIKSLEIIKPSGRLITVPTFSHAEILVAAEERGINTKGILVDMNQETLKNILRLIHEEKIKLRVFKKLPLTQARQAHELIQAGKAKGKVILVNN